MCACRSCAGAIRVARTVNKFANVGKSGGGEATPTLAEPILKLSKFKIVDGEFASLVSTCFARQHTDPTYIEVEG